MQHLQEDLSGGLEVEAFSGCVVVLAGEITDLVLGEGSEVCFSGQGSAQASDGVLDAAFLPGGMGLAEERLDAEGLGEVGVLSELGSVVEGDGLAKFAWQGSKQGLDGGGDGCGMFAGLAADGEDSGGSLVQGEDGLAVGSEEHEVGFPMSWVGAVGGLIGPQGNGNAAFDVQGWAAAFAAAPAPPGLGSGQVEAPGVVLGSGDLGGDEAVDGFMADEASAVFAFEAAGDLLGRPAFFQAVEDQGLEVGIAQELGASPAPGLGLFGGVARPIAGLAVAVALQLARDARWRAIQSCRDLPDRLPACAALGKLAAFLQAEVPI